MARTNLTKRTVRDPENLRVKLAEHDTALDALDTTGTLPANSVSNSEFRQSGALAVVGRSANSTGNVADIQATAASDAVLRESGSAIGFGTIAAGGIASGAVTNAKLGTGAVTGLKIAATAIKTFVVAAGNGSGARTATGARVGDKVITVVNLTDLTNDAADFESVITVNDQIQQTGTDHTGDVELVQVITVT